MDSNRIAYLIRRFRSQQATKEEIDELESFWYLAKDDDTLFSVFTLEEKDAIRKAMLANIKKRTILVEKQPETKQRSLPVLSWTLKIAASVAVIAAVFFYRMRNDAEQMVFQTAYGQQMDIVLPDSSHVVVNGNSSLRYNMPWNEGEDREVWIEGEAFFDVTHKVDNKRFVVHTDYGMNVQVLGTKFNVKVRRGKAEVMLQEGSVRLNVERNNSTEAVMLNPGELATLENEKVLKSNVNADQYIAWKERKLVFEQTPLRGIADILEDTYGLEVVFENDSLGERKLSGQISAYSAEDIINAIKESLDVNITYNENKVVFHQ